MTLIELADQIAAEAHSKQFRNDGKTPYITHPRAVKDITLTAEDAGYLIWE